jgi:FixJ family two-component response regulator
VKTVEAHRARVMVKMDVGSVAELVQAALSAQRPR